MPHGWATAPHWMVIARRAKVPTATALAVAIYAFDIAAKASDRGSIDCLDVETAGAFLQVEDEDIRNVLEAMKDKGIIVHGRWSGWDDLQKPKDNTNAERQRRFKEKNRKDRSAGNAVTDQNNAVTKTDNAVTTVTGSEKTPLGNAERKIDRKTEQIEDSPPISPSPGDGGPAQQPELIDMTPTGALIEDEDPVSDAVKLYNEAADRCGLSRAQKATDKRRKAIKARLSECGGIDGWRVALEKMEASSFCRGEKTDWRANIDFLCQQSSFVKLMEGAYDDTRPAGRRNGHATQSPPRTGAPGFVAGLGIKDEDIPF